MTRLFTSIAAVGLLAVAGCGSVGAPPSGPSSSPTPVSTQAPPPTTPPVDPYEVYLQHAPAGAPTLSREDAQTRALLGCGQPWAPGTVDAALAQAYADLCRRAVPTT